MARNCVFLVLILCTTLVCDAAIFHPISDSHRSAALEIFAPVDGSFGSLEEAYEALRTFEILGIGKELNIRASACPSVVDTLGSSSSSLKDLFYALRVNVALKCEISEEVFAGTASRCKASVHDAKSLFDFYYSIGSLRLIKDQTSEVDVLLSDADGIFQAIKALSQSDGRWRYSSNNPASSTYAAGVALQTLAGVVSLATSEIDQSLIGMLQNDIVKLFDGIEKYDDGAFYFDEKLVDALGHQGPLSATSSVVRGLTAFAAATSGSLNLPGDKILGLANFFLAIGIPGSAKDFYDQIDALACLESNRVSIPLILSLPATVLSLTRKDQLKPPPPLHRFGVCAESASGGDNKSDFGFGLCGGKRSSYENDETITFHPTVKRSSGRMGYDDLARMIEKKGGWIGKSLSCLEFDLPLGRPVVNGPSQDLLSCIHRSTTSVGVGRLVRVNTVLGSTAPHLSVKLVQAFSSGSKGASIVESQELKFDSENDVHFLDALPKSVDLGTYHFVFEIVLHDSEEKNIYATGSRTKVPIYVTGVIKVDNAEIAVLDSDLGSIETQKKLDLAGETVLSLSANHLQKLRLSFQLTTPLGHSFKPHQDFLGLVEKFFYLSGRYDIQLTVGDAVMENSYLRELGSIELDLPEPPEKATRPPPQPVDPYLRYGPKAEIAHIFRTPEKRPPQELSLAFLALVILPFLGFVVGLLRLGVNLKNFPTSTVPATFAILFQLGIAAVRFSRSMCFSG
ncbi:ribophorin II (RPN2) family protein [Actinidia rufa]|uniref:Dolichyl-diphosphooligosaccharide--protein glycosyltransferase subunit 2 n=1 Tax=Actinidia rufa TaxID=165716 RepID=A0A7J0H4L0_9ERIC|nr:ribophorin II (RPN2) family protein [Actinidia rufa]